MNGSRRGSVSLEEPEEPVSKRHPNKPSGPKLNTWDVPEFLPGALPRANPVQRAYFEERSKKVFKNNLIMDEIEAEASRERKAIESAEKMETDMASLTELFPTLDLVLIQETYLLMNGDMQSIISQLLLISESDSPLAEKKGPPSSDDEREFPQLGGHLKTIPSGIEMDIQEYDIPSFQEGSGVNPKDT